MDPPTPVDLVLQFGFKSIISGYSSKNSTKKGQALVEAGHVYKVAEFRIGNKSFITSQVVRQTSVNLTPYDVRLELNSNREAIIRLCSCAAGESSICKHISATIAYVNTHTGSSKTNEPQLWGKPSVLQSLRENYSHAKAVEDLYPVPKKMKLAIGLVKPADISATHLSGIPCALSYMLQAEERSIGDKIARSIVMDLAVEAVTFSVKRKSRQVLWQIVDLNFVSQIFGKSFYNLGLGAKHLKYFEKKIQVSPEDVINIAMETIDQSSNRKWMVERDCRVSASSKAHRIKIRKKDHDLLADQFLSPKPFKGNMATRYGNQMEKAALQQYEMILATAGIQVAGKREPDQEREAQEWIESILGERFPGHLPYEDVLRDGTRLCRLMNVLQPGIIPRINTAGGDYKMMDNLSQFQKACVAYGVPDVDLFQTVDLWDKKDIARVTMTIFAIGRTAYKHPEWRGPWLGPRPAEENRRDFSEDQLRAGEGVIGLQAGSNKGATQAGQYFGTSRKILLGK